MKYTRKILKKTRKKSKQSSKNTILFVPGKKNTEITNNRYEAYFLKNNKKNSKKSKNTKEDYSNKVTLFDYRSQSNASDTGRLVWDTIGFWPSDAVRRMVALLETEKPAYILAHSHGSQILYNALALIDRETLENIKYIRTFGARKPIPNKIQIRDADETAYHSIDVLNHYNDCDWVFRLILKIGFLPEKIKTMPRNEIFEIDDTKFEILDTPPNTKSYDITIENKNPKYQPEQRKFQCATDPQDSHKIPCYSKKIMEYIRRYSK